MNGRKGYKFIPRYLSWTCSAFFNSSFHLSRQYLRSSLILSRCCSGTKFLLTTKFPWLRTSSTLSWFWPHSFKNFYDRWEKNKKNSQPGGWCYPASFNPGIKVFLNKHILWLLPQGRVFVSLAPLDYYLVLHKNPDFSQYPLTILTMLLISGSNSSIPEVCSLARKD